jgi:hypothetical protein
MHFDTDYSNDCGGNPFRTFAEAAGQACNAGDISAEELAKLLGRPGATGGELVGATLVGALGGLVGGAVGLLGGGLLSTTNSACTCRGQHRQRQRPFIVAGGEFPSSDNRRCERCQEAIRRDVCSGAATGGSIGLNVGSAVGAAVGAKLSSFCVRSTSEEGPSPRASSWGSPRHTETLPQCPNGHNLRTDVRLGRTAICDNCGKASMRNWSCPRCDFDVCDQCKSKFEQFMRDCNQQ